MRSSGRIAIALSVLALSVSQATADEGPRRPYDIGPYDRQDQRPRFITPSSVALEPPPAYTFDFDGRPYRGSPATRQAIGVQPRFTAPPAYHVLPYPLNGYQAEYDRRYPPATIRLIPTTWEATIMLIPTQWDAEIVLVKSGVRRIEQ